jgi:hypothetical protein
MDHVNSFYALDIATDRVDDVFGMEFEHRWEARQARRAAELSAGDTGQISFIRRAVAKGLAKLSRGSARAVRRLDRVAADDLSRRLAAAE